MANLKISIPTVDVLKNTPQEELESALDEILDSNFNWSLDYIIGWLYDNFCNNEKFTKEKVNEFLNMSHLIEDTYIGGKYKEEFNANVERDKDLYLDVNSDDDYNTNIINYNDLLDNKEENDYDDDDEY